MNGSSTVLVSAVTALVVGSAAGFGGYLIGEENQVEGTPTVLVTPAPEVVEDKVEENVFDVASIAEELLPAVVSILVEAGDNSGTGSGFVVESDGFILTNNHVIESGADGAGEITVVFNNGSKEPATIVGRNASYDIAVLKVNRTGLDTALLGNSSTVKVGESVVAIGAPLGLNGTVTSGIVSSLDRPVTAGGGGGLSFINAIQTDAAINPGNSGGPLVNAKNQVIGVNSAIATLGMGDASGSIGLGFSIPINVAKRIAQEIIKTGESQTPVIGVSLDDLFMGDGAKIAELVPGGAAEAAGILVGDIIIGVNERLVADPIELVVAIRSYAPGEGIGLTVKRGGQEIDILLSLGTA